jgi:hypothetical protein
MPREPPVSCCFGANPGCSLQATAHLTGYRSVGIETGLPRDLAGGRQLPGDMIALAEIHLIRSLAAKRRVRDLAVVRSDVR